MALYKWGRNYRLDITIKNNGIDQILTVQPPFTLEFDITRNTLSSANVCQIRIYNLNEKHRNQIRFNSYDYYTFQPISLKAGYGENLATIFTGNITQAWSVREGTNFITQIECFDGGFALINSTSDRVYNTPTPRAKILSDLMSDLDEVEIGNIGNYTDIVPAGTVSGNTAELLIQYSGNAFFIDQGKSYALQTNEVIPSLGNTLVINSASGLLATPLRETTKLIFDMIFEPSLNVGTVASIQSSTEANYNNTYKVIGVKHRGMISDAMCGNAITTVELDLSSRLIPAVG